MTFDESGEQFRKSYAAGRDAYQRVRDDRRFHTARIVITVLDAILFATLERYTSWSFVSEISVSLAAFALALYLAARLFHSKTG